MELEKEGKPLICQATWQRGGGSQSNQGAPPKRPFLAALSIVICKLYDNYPNKLSNFPR